MYLYKNHSSEFIISETKYSKYYFLIIERALNEQRTKLKKSDTSYVYYENHHILPKSLFPAFSKLKDNPWNSVLLTAREHFLVHALIYKHFKSINHKNQYKMDYAFKSMSKFKIDARYNSRLYEYCMITFKHTEETKLKMSNNCMGRPVSKESIEKRLNTLKTAGYDMGKLISQGLNKIEANGNSVAKNACMRSVQSGLNDIIDGENSYKRRAKIRVKNMQVPDENGETVMQKAIESMRQTRQIKNDLGYTSFETGAAKGAITRAISGMCIVIFDEHNQPIFVTSNFSQLCKEHKLPRERLSISFKNHGEKIYPDLSNGVHKRLINSGFDKFIGWSAMLIEEVISDSFQFINQF